LIKAKPSANCESRQARETVAHVISECYLFQRQRKAIFGFIIGRDDATTLSNLVLAKKAAKFTLKTGVLNQFSRYSKDIE
jgi:hypothetical protein